ncbi:MAG: ATP-binding protein [Tepidimonas sp.]|nr:ATP-binding protein [Tepidimonas sp.]
MERMETYDPKSCNALAKPYYRPIEAALRWCNLIAHESLILQVTGDNLVPPASAFPQWPCLRLNAEKIFDAIENHELPYGRDGRTVAPGEHVARHRLTIRHTDLKAWMAKHYPDQKPSFLFDEVERNTHASYNAATFAALQAQRDAARAELEAARKRVESQLRELEAMRGERDSLRAMVDKQMTINPRAETTYLNIIGGLLDLMLGTTPSGQRGSIYESQAAIISALLAHHGGKPGIADSTLEQKFAEARRSIKAT